MNRRRFPNWFRLGTLGALFGSGFWLTQAKNRYYSGPVTDHFDGRTFFNPNGVPPGKFTDFLRWKLLDKSAEWPESYASEHHGTAPKQRVAGHAIEVTLIGHATMLIQVNGLNLITDPILSDRASPFRFVGPKRINPPGISFDTLPAIDAVLLTHNHYDHLDLSSLARLVERDDPTIVTPLGNDAIVKSIVPGATIRTGDWGDVVEFPGNTRVHFEPCHHWSARGARDRRMALWSAFVIETPKAKIYHVGDTGFHSGINYQRAADKFGTFDLAILPIGAYEPRWFMKGQHQNPDEAVEGFKICNADHAVGHHWGTFQLTNESIEEPKRLLARALEKNGVDPERFVAMLPGQVWRR